MEFTNTCNDFESERNQWGRAIVDGQIKFVGFSFIADKTEYAKSIGLDNSLICDFRLYTNEYRFAFDGMDFKLIADQVIRNTDTYLAECYTNVYQDNKELLVRTGVRGRFRKRPVYKTVYKCEVGKFNERRDELVIMRHIQQELERQHLIVMEQDRAPGRMMLRNGFVR